MTVSHSFDIEKTRLIAALHLPPFPGSCHPKSQTVDEIIEYALRNAKTAYDNGFDALYIQDVFDSPQGTRILPHTIACMGAIGHAVRTAFPTWTLGFQFIGHGAKEPIATAHAVGFDFVRIKTWIGTMVRSSGIEEGLAYEAIRYRSEIDAHEVAILADVYDRSGMPLAPLTLVEAATSAVRFGRADGLVITGHSFDNSLEMLEQVRGAKLGVPLYLGGGGTAANINQALRFASGVIISTSLKAHPDRSPGSLPSDWGADKVKAFVDAVRSGK